MLNIAFMGSPEFAVGQLDKLFKYQKCNIKNVYTKPPKKQGRGMYFVNTPVHNFAQKVGLNVFTPSKLADINFTKYDIVIVSAYGILIPAHVLSHPRLGFINVHPSLLPRWRGASPIESAILNNDKVTGVTIIQLDQGMDTGNIILQEKYCIEPDDNIITVSNVLSDIASDLLINIIDNIENKGQYNSIPQSISHVTYCHKINRNKLLYLDDCSTYDLSLYLKAFLSVRVKLSNGLILKIHSIESFEKNNNNKFPLGTFVFKEGKYKIILKDGYVYPMFVQLEGGKKLSIEDFISGHKKKIDLYIE